MYVELIKKRCSVRTFTLDIFSKEKLSEIENILKNVSRTPFNTYGRFKMIKLDQGEGRSLVRAMTTYGVIKNPQYFLVGMINKVTGNLVDFGHSFEKIILDLTALDIGTCWLGGTFNQSIFAKYAQCLADEVIPCVVALGVSASLQSPTDRLIKFMAASHKRKEWKALFFQNNFKDFAVLANHHHQLALEMVRLAPSASNKQPWRILYEDNCFHFYLDRNSSYNRLIDFLNLADLQLVDMGIAMCHLELALLDAKILGQFEFIKGMEQKHYTYITSFRC
ncbi:MAG: hypothetical protein A2381_02045 [Bdellovibrionales bacterium RIFOXYB1_FULL_37_110]|nr:MAG: hypothetical protein A2417_13350 [Bdellovibrionales bacterium RIFOXYC1_FULL_37_79]OFZ53556.1 MAG: hypothetical protein A2328_11340 [Bdellovibrionales bacterium RIFOXYB2_FULL_36_6]OFZ59221.1 MAG: hypothetical protein A2381_02045 [Bdellovibrionales bacterium RIFOXYB1_FULL_37_110]OFZ62847.1 MAG: hypothetical protein A2577_11000 [Bdellovibrionales bacterium RIFOXYD1_FULL_36_51]